MRRRRAVLGLSFLLAGCGYPDFVFPEAGVDASTSVDGSADTKPVDASEVAVDASDDARDAPDVSPCDGGGTLCGKSCVDTSNNRSNCGGCGVVCGASEVCMVGACSALPSCAVLHATFPTLISGAYIIDPDGKPGPVVPFETWCEMKEDGGGWTLALKADGNKKTFEYESPLWTSELGLNPTATTLDTATEAKLASFWTMPFTQIRIGMSEAGVRRYTSLNVAAPSLRAAFMGGAISTAGGRAQWFKLLSSPVLQFGCDAEGINRTFATPSVPYAARVRIGILGNNEANCESPDSYIAIGGGFAETHSCVGTDPGVVVGNMAPSSCGPTIEARATKTFGYVFVR